MAVAVGVLAAAPPAGAAGPKEAQAQRALKKALDEDYLQTRFDAAEKKLRVALKVCGKACSAKLRAKLHFALGAVLAGGKKELEDARDEFVVALALDPNGEPNPDLLSTEVAFAYEQARKKLGLTPSAAATPEPKPPKKHAAPDEPSPVVEKPEPDDKPDPGEKPDRERAPAPPEKAETGDASESSAPAEPAEPVRKNWITITFAPDLAIVSGTNVCTGASQASAHYVCLRSDGTRYAGTPTIGNADNINTGIALATLRLTLGYERVVHPNLTVGLRAGFAFNGASGGGASFMPVHAEGRFGIWPGHDPFVGRGVRPFFILSGGLAQVDAKVNVQVLEDGTACGAMPPGNTSSPCTTPSSDGTVEKRVQTLTVFKQNGLGFAALSFGLQFAPSTRVTLHLAARASVTFPVVVPVISPEGGVSVGF